MRVKYLIIGAGPTGLGAAHRLRELGQEDFLVLEKNAYAGGLAASFTDNAGFTWDIGGHVVFSHYDYFDALVEDMLRGDYLEHQRIAAVRLASTWAPYPFQNNIGHLPPALQWECVQGLLPGRRDERMPTNFREWILHVFGEGIARHFMLPYNFKVWATPPEKMAFNWIGERVSVIELDGVLKNLIMRNDDDQWGPNRTFRFPLYGGTGEIFRRLAATLMDRVRFGAAAAWLDADNKTLHTADGQAIEYDLLFNTSPLDLFVTEVMNDTRDAVRAAANKLKHNSVYVAGVGVDGVRRDDKCWMYFPETNCPFYRLTNFHIYSPRNTAVPGAQRALMAETSMSEHKLEDTRNLMDRTVDGLVNTSMLDEAERGRILSTWDYTADYGYPVPTLERDAALNLLIPLLEKAGIYSRGRFGGWKYEAANMDHSVMQGVEWADRMLMDHEEKTYRVDRSAHSGEVRRAA